MAEKYFLTTDADSWWLCFRLAEGHASDPTRAVTAGAGLGVRPLGEVVRNGVAVDSITFSATARAAETSPEWTQGYTAYYDDEEGAVNVSLTGLLTGSPVGERIFVRLIAEPDTLIATAELVNTRDENRNQDCTGDSLCSVAACDGDEYLSFRIADGGVDATYVGPRLMSSGSSNPYYVDLRRTGTDQSTWPYRYYADYDPLTGLADALISEIINIAEPGDSFVYRLFAVGSPLAHIAEGVLTYQPNDCVGLDDPTAATRRYDLTANSATTHLRFRVKNFDPDPTLAIVTSATIGRAPQPLEEGEGTFFFRYRIDDETVWRTADVFLDGEEGVAEVAMSAILQKVDALLEFRLIADSYTVAYGTIAYDEDGDEGVSRPPCGSAPIVDVILERLEPTVSLEHAGGGTGAEFTAALSPFSAPGGMAWGVSAVSVSGGGTGYVDGSKLSVVVSGRIVEESAADMYLNVTDGNVESVTIDDSGAYYMTGGVESLDLVYGGAFYPSPACDYTWNGCAACCDNHRMKISFAAGGQEHTLKATTINEYGITTATIFEAVTPADGGDWTDLTFATGSFYPGVESIAVTAGGSGYTSPPTVTITGDGSGAQAVATVKGYVDSITLTSEGFDFYETAPAVTISGGGGAGATATATAGFGGLKITLGSGGSGYTSVPTVTISGGGGSGATAVATIRQAVDSITVTKSGSGYTAAPTVTLSGGGGSGAVAVATLEREPVGCYTSGTATLSAADCTDTTAKDLPDQVVMTLSGIAPIFWWASQNGGALPGVCVAEGGDSGWGNVFCGRCDGAPQDGIRYRVVGNAFGAPGYSLAQAIDNFSVVLDKSPSCSPIVYSGFTKSLPAAGYNTALPDTVVQCGGDLSIPVSLTLDCVPITTTVSISAPTKGNSLETATAEITGVSGGAVSGLTLTNPGSGYAVEVIDRVTPEIAAGVFTKAGTGADLSVVLTKSGDGDEAFWSVSSVEINDAGAGYAPSEEVSFSTSDEVYDQAVAFITVATTEPTLSASVSGGSGAELSVTLSETTDYYDNKVWAVDAVTVSAGGTGYTDGSPVVFTVDDGQLKSEASATIATGREEPGVTAAVVSGTGSGAVLSVTLTQSGNSWYVSGVTVVDGGAGYDGYYSDYVVFATSDTEASQAYAAITTDGNGTITAVSMYGGGSYYRSTGVIESVTVGSGGEYYKSDGEIESVVVFSGGAYWRLQGTGEADADTPTVTISGSYGIGSGATAEATVDTTVGSPTFGQISSLSLTNGGSGYKTQASGWRATVGVGLVHRTDCLVLNDAGGCSSDGAECPGFGEAYSEPESSRVTDNNSPAALISRSYKMAYRAATFSNGSIENADNATYCFSGPYGATLTITDMGAGDIVVSVSPA